MTCKCGDQMAVVQRHDDIAYWACGCGERIAVEDTEDAVVAVSENLEKP